MKYFNDCVISQYLHFNKSTSIYILLFLYEILFNYILRYRIKETLEINNEKPRT